MLAYLEWLALYAGIAVGSHVAHASTLVNCSAGNPAGSYYSSSDSTGNGAWQNTGVYMQPFIQGPPNGSGILIWKSPIGNGAGYAIISVGGTAAAGSGAIVLRAPNGVSVFGTMVTSGLSTFQAGVNMSGTRISNLAPRHGISTKHGRRQRFTALWPGQQHGERTWRRGNCGCQWGAGFSLLHYAEPLIPAWEV